MSPRTRSLLLLHGVVVIFGFTGILGKLISIEAEPLVFWRVTLGGLTTALYLMIRRKWVAWDVLSALKAGGIGWIVAAHWVTFFASIKASSVGLALTMLATAPLFVGLIEPLVYKRKLAWRELAVAAMVFVGIALVFQAEQDQTLGILLGLASSVLAAVFSTLNGVMVRQHDPINLSAVELLSASLGMGVWLVVQQQFDGSLFSLSSADWLWIGLLAVVATSFAFMVSIQVLKDLTPFESAMAINLEPIYAIVLAYFLFGERFSPGFYLGAALVIGAVFLDTLLRARKPETATTPPDRL
jgi:drug/metabolite transporter (DMT)-like permease